MLFEDGVLQCLAGNVGDMSRDMRVARMSPDYGDIAMSPRHFSWWHEILVMSHSYLFIYRVSVLWHSSCHNVNMWQSHVVDMSCVATSCVSKNALRDISCRQHSQLSCNGRQNFHTVLPLLHFFLHPCLLFLSTSNKSTKIAFTSWVIDHKASIEDWGRLLLLQARPLWCKLLPTCQAPGNTHTLGLPLQKSPCTLHNQPVCRLLRLWHHASQFFHFR